MHLALFGLLIWSSLYQTVEIMGGGEGEGDASGSCDGRYWQRSARMGTYSTTEKKVKLIKQKKPEPVVEEKKPEPEPKSSKKLRKQRKRLSVSRKIQRQKRT